MFGRQDLATQMFADQFEPDGDGYLYRKRLKGAPIRVSAEERAEFMAAYERTQGWSKVCIIVAVVVGVMGTAVVAVISGQEFTAAPIVAVLVLLVIIFVGIDFWLWQQPARALEGRLPVGQERSKDELARRHLEKLNWGTIAGSGALFVFLFWRMTGFRDLLQGWNLLWLIGCGAGLLLVTVQGFRKWRLQQASR